MYWSKQIKNSWEIFYEAEHFANVPSIHSFFSLFSCYSIGNPVQLTLSIHISFNTLSALAFHSTLLFSINVWGNQTLFFKRMPICCLFSLSYCQWTYSQNGSTKVMKMVGYTIQTMFKNGYAAEPMYEHMNNSMCYSTSMTHLRKEMG